MDLRPIPSGESTVEEARGKEAAKSTERDHAAIMRSVATERPVRPGILQRLRFFLRRA